MSAKALAATTAERKNNLRRMHVVPRSDELKIVKCAIGKEQLDNEFLTMSGYGAMLSWLRTRYALLCELPTIMDTLRYRLVTEVYHATCHADALSSRTALALRAQCKSIEGPHYGFALDQAPLKQA